MRNQSRRKRRYAAKRKAEQLIASEFANVDSILNSSAENHERNSGQFTYRLCRPVLLDNHDSFFNKEPFLDILQENMSQAQLIGGLATSHFRPKENRRLLEIFGQSSAQLKEALDDATNDVPAELSGTLGRAVIMGRLDSKPGIRHVAMSFEQPLRRELESERENIMSDLGVKFSKSIPHISVHTTTDRQTADRLMGQINELSPTGEAVVLGSLGISPIDLYGKLDSTLCRS